MVNKIRKNGYFSCGECGMKFRKRDLAHECENWCKEKQSCNLDIIKHAADKIAE